MILIEIKIEARYLKKNSQTPQEKNPRNFISIKIIWLFGLKSQAFLLNGTLVQNKDDFFSKVWSDGKYRC